MAVDNPVPGRIAGNLRSLLESLGQALDVDDIPIAYKARFGEKLDFRSLGFESVGELLKCIPRVATLYSHQFVRPAPSSPGCIINPQIEYPPSIANTSHSSAVPPKSPQSCIDIPSSPVAPKLPDVNQKAKKESVNKKGKWVRKNNMWVREVEDSEADQEDETDSTLPLTQEDPLVEEMKMVQEKRRKNSDLYEHMSKAIEEIEVRSNKSFEKDLELSETPPGQRELEERIQAIKLKSEENGKHRRPLQELVSIETKENIRDLLSIFPMGIRITDFQREYKTEFGWPIDFERFGCVSLAEFCHMLPDVFKVVHSVVQKDTILFDVRKPDQAKVIEVQNKMAEQDEPKKPSSRTPDFSWMASPFYRVPTATNSLSKSDFLDSSFRFPSNPFDRRLAYGDFINIVITAVHSPAQFFVQVRDLGAETYIKMLERDLEKFYTSKEVSETLVEPPARDIIAGSIFACFYKNRLDEKSDTMRWYRVVVTRFVNANGVLCFFIDFGRSILVSKKCLRPLHKQFGTLPSQAIECKLSGVVPPGDFISDWPLPSRAEFSRLLNPILAGGSVTVVASKPVQNKPLGLVLVDAVSEVESRGPVLNLIFVRSRFGKLAKGVEGESLKLIVERYKEEMKEKVRQVRREWAKAGKPLGGVAMAERKKKRHSVPALTQSERFPWNIFDASQGPPLSVDFATERLNHFYPPPAPPPRPPPYSPPMARIPLNVKGLGITQLPTTAPDTPVLMPVPPMMQVGQSFDVTPAHHEATKGLQPFRLPLNYQELPASSASPPQRPPCERILSNGISDLVNMRSIGRRSAPHLSDIMTSTPNPSSDEDENVRVCNGNYSVEIDRAPPTY